MNGSRTVIWIRMPSVKPLNPTIRARSGAYRRRVTSMVRNILDLAAMFLLASSVTAQETPSSVSSSVWKIYYTKNEAYSATAVAIGGNRFITNAHFFTAFVGLDTRYIALKKQGEREVIGFRRVLALSMTYDLAIFETKKNVDSYLHLASRFSKDEFIYVLGYPEGSLRRLNLAARVTYEDSLSFLLALDGESLSGETFLGGLSGSPVVNEKGNFVALIHATTSVPTIIRTKSTGWSFRDSISCSWCRKTA